MVLSLRLYQLNIWSTILHLIRFDAIWCPGILVMQDFEHSHGTAQDGARLTDPSSSASQAGVFHLSSFPDL